MKHNHLEEAEAAGSGEKSCRQHQPGQERWISQQQRAQCQSASQEYPGECPYDEVQRWSRNWRLAGRGFRGKPGQKRLGPSWKTAAKLPLDQATVQRIGAPARLRETH